MSINKKQPAFLQQKNQVLLSCLLDFVMRKDQANFMNIENYF